MKAMRVLTAAGAAITLVSAASAGGNDLAPALLADAAGRTALAAPQNEKFTVNVGGHMQFRYIFNQRDDAPDGEDDTTLGFQARRTRIEVGGQIFSDSWGYKVVGAFNRQGGAFELEDAYGTYKLGDSWTLMWGQFKLPFMREKLVSTKYQLAADRSVVNEVFNQDRGQGVQVAHQGESLRFMGAFSDGFNSDNTEFTNEPADYALTGRVEWKWAGAWKQFSDFTSFRDGAYGGLLGGAVHWESGGETNGTTDSDMLTATGDVSVEGNGWNAFGAVVYRKIEPASGDDLSDWGAVVQGGLFVTDQTEVFARYDVTIPDGDRSNDDAFNTFTVGLNHYCIPESHAAKFTLDLQCFFDNPTESLVPSASSGRGIGLLTNDEGDGQWAIRAQMQLLF